MFEINLTRSSLNGFNSKASLYNGIEKFDLRPKEGLCIFVWFVHLAQWLKERFLAKFCSLKATSFSYLNLEGTGIFFKE